MKINHLYGILAAMAVFTTAQAQVKVGDNPGTINGGSALEIESTNKGLLMPRVALTSTTTWGLAGTAVAGMSVYNTGAGLASSNTSYPAMGVGEYYWDGTGWVSKKGGSTGTTSVNADNGLTVGYNSTGNVGLGGTLSKNTTVAQGANTLNFTSAATSGTSHFTIDGSTFNVDAVNGRVSINTLAPKSFFHVTTKTAGASIDAGIFSIDNCGGLCAQGTARNLVLNNANDSNGLFASLDFVASKDPTAPSGASIQGIDRDASSNYAGLTFYTRNATDYKSRMVIKSSGNVGIGTESPATKLEVNSGTTAGAIKIVDGTQGAGKTLISDANGVGTWQTLSAIKPVALGVFPNPAQVITANGTGQDPVNTGVYVELTKGKWIVSAGMTIEYTLSNVTSRDWLHAYLSTSTTTIQQNGFTHLGPAGQNTAYAGAITVVPGGNNPHKFNFVQGTSVIDVTGSSVKIYLMIQNVNSYKYGTNSFENYFYATPVN